MGTYKTILMNMYMLTYIFTHEDILEMVLGVVRCWNIYTAICGIAFCR